MDMPIGEFAKKLLFSFVRAFLGTFVVGLAGVTSAPNWTAGKAALVALVVAAVTAGFRAVQVLIPGVDSHT